MEQLTVFILPHTHWDREWYLPFERFRRRLVDIIDRLCTIMTTDGSFERFTLDGQAVVVEDYLAIRPEQEGVLRELVRQERLTVGPWYVLPDEFLVGGEALIRNLLIGRSKAARYGRPMAVGYLPDSFGHVAQLPQILRGMGIKSAMFARGVGDEGEELGSEFWWEAPDGSRVLAVHQVRGYCNAVALGHVVPSGAFEGGEVDPALAVQRVRQELEHLRPYARAGVVLLNSGCDHQPANEHLPRLVDHLRRTLPALDVRWATPDEVVAEILARNPALDTWRGELRGSRYTPLIPGVLSTRMYLKQANEATQMLLERWAEPLAAVARSVGLSSTIPYLDYAWELLLQNHPHDSICGCSIDEVHREMLTRFARVAAVAEEVAAQALAAIAREVDTRTLAPGLPVVVWNPLNWPRTGVVRCSVSLPADAARRLSARDASGRVLSCQILGRFRQVLARERVPGEQITQRLWWLSHEIEAAWGVRFASFRLRRDLLTVETAESALCPPDVLDRLAAALRQRRADLTVRVQRTVLEVALLVRDIPPVGYTTLVLTTQPGAQSAALPDGVQVTGAATLENPYLAVEVRRDGTVAVYDKGTGRRTQAHVLEDAGDTGDEYDHSPVDDPPILASGLAGRAAVVHPGPVIGIIRVRLPLKLPASLRADRRRRARGRIACRVTIDVTLAAGSRVVEFTTVVENRARDHRLRVRFPTGILADGWMADTPFGAVERLLRRPTGEGWVQPPQPTAPHESWVDVANISAGLAVLSAGLPEHEVIAGADGLTVALTLLRCVGWLSRDDLRTRTGHAGPGYATPEAQCIGMHRFRYGLLPHAGGWLAADLDRQALAFRTPLRATFTGQHDGRLLPMHGFLACDGAIVSALKLAVARDGVVIRIYNPTPAERQAVIQTPLPHGEAREIDLAEEDVGPVPMRDGTVDLALKPFQIRSIKLIDL